jgi:hypothetical protein
LYSYESIKTVTVPTSKDSGTFGGMLLNSPPSTTNCYSVYLSPRISCSVTDETRTTTGAGTEVADSVKDLNKSDDRGEKTADNIRYGQNISESGMGGMTEGNSGSASTGGECGNPSQSLLLTALLWSQDYADRLKLDMAEQRQKQARRRAQRTRGRRQAMEGTKIWTRLLVVDQARRSGE